MAFTSWSVIFGEQPAASKWNQLGENDNGFKDGTNIDGGAITAQHLATSAIKLGTPGVRTTSQSFTTQVQLTSLTTTVTIPSDTTRSVFAMLYIPNLKNDNASSDAVDTVKIWSGTVGSGTLLQQADRTQPAQYRSPFFLITKPLVIGTDISAGSVTFNASANQSSGPGELLATVAGTAFIQAVLV